MQPPKKKMEEPKEVKQEASSTGRVQNKSFQQPKNFLIKPPPLFFLINGYQFLAKKKKKKYTSNRLKAIHFYFHFDKKNSFEKFSFPPPLNKNLINFFHYHFKRCNTDSHLPFPHLIYLKIIENFKVYFISFHLFEI